MEYSVMFDKRLLFITGKGGVGKTTIAASIAIAAKELGLKTLLVEIGITQNLEQIFRKWLPVYDITHIEDGLHVIRIDPLRALEEYIALSLKMQWAAKKFMDMEMVRYLLQFLPGWRDLMILGKIWKLEQEVEKGKGAHPKWDLIVVDSPATGHGINFFRIPQVILDTLRTGTLRKQTEAVHEMMTDPARTQINVVSLAEEMPINESIEIHQATIETLKMPFGRVFINMMPPKILGAKQLKIIDELEKEKKALKVLDSFFPGGHQRLITAARQQSARRKLAEGYVASGRKKIDAEFIELPHIFRETMDREGLGLLAREIIDRVN
jgi:anion-transporting  ArsA/GET3 family ATPase